MRLRIQEPNLPPRDLQLQQPIILIGRDANCDVAFDPARFPKVSGIHAELRQQDGQVIVIHRSRSNRTLLNEQPLERDTPVKVGDRIRLGFTGPTITIVALSTVAPNSKPLDRQSPSTAATQLAVNASEILRGTKTTRKIVIGQGGTIGRDLGQVQFHLDHPLVSRVHARLTLKNGETVLADLGSANGTFVNGERLKSLRILRANDQIDIGPFSLIFDGQALNSTSRSNNVQLVASHVGRIVQNTTSRSKLTLLSDITLVINPGEFVAIIGPSGSGKSTLLGVISGRTAPTSGCVAINNQDLHHNFAALKEDLAVVPQSTMLHESLTVEQTLAYTAALRLPPDTTRQERAASIDRIVNAVGLDHRRNIKIHQLSGGQLKRAGLGCELMSDPSLLFLDEVTSGLDEHSDGEMMRLFRQLANQGKTLVCVTHNLSHVEQNCHLVAVLTVGGHLAFFGRPAEALDYFGVERLADVYVELPTRQPNEWALAFQKSGYCQQYIQSRMPTNLAAASSTATHVDARGFASFFRQWNVLIQRNIAVWRNDVSALLALFGQAILVAFLLCMVFGDLSFEELPDPTVRLPKIRNVLFLVAVSSFWLGCNNSVKEIVKERRIYQRERDFNLIPEAFLASKLLVMALLGIFQALLLGIIVLGWCSVSGTLLGHLAVLCGLSFVGTSLGVAISSLAKTEEVAVAAVPIVIIPQIILAGVVADLPWLPDRVARVLTTVYWGQKGMEQTIDEMDRIVGSFSPSIELVLLVLGLHSLVFIAIAWYGCRWLRVR